MPVGNAEGPKTPCAIRIRTHKSGSATPAVASVESAGEPAPLPEGAVGELVHPDDPCNPCEIRWTMR